MNPYLLLGTIGLSIMLLTGIGAKSYGVGHRNGINETQVKWDADAAKREKQRNADIAKRMDEIKQISNQLTAASAALEKARNEKQIIYRTIIKHTDTIVDRPVYRNVCLDPDGVRDINAAFAGRAAAANAPDSAAKPDAVVPAADPVGGDGRPGSHP